MSILTRLITKEWCRFFILAAMVLFLLMTVANLLAGFLRETVTTSEVFFNYLIQLPSSLNKIFPISCMVASLLSINKFKNRNELAVIFASGYSRRGFVFTIIQISLVVGLLQFLIAGYLDPFIKRHRNVLIKDSARKFRNLKSQGLSASTIGTGKIWYKSGNYFFSFLSFDKSNNILNEVSIYFFDDEHILKKKIESKKFRYDAEINKWIGDKGRIYSYLNQKDFPKIKKVENFPLQIEEKPADFKKIESDITILNIVQLYDYIQKLKYSGINTNEYEVMFWDKISTSLICVIFALVAIGGIFKPNRRGSSFVKNIIIVFVFMILYWLLYSSLIEMGKNSRIDSLLACFGVPIMFGVYLAYRFYRNSQLR